MDIKRYEHRTVPCQITLSRTTSAMYEVSDGSYVLYADHAAAIAAKDAEIERLRLALDSIRGFAGVLSSRDLSDIVAGVRAMMEREEAAKADVERLTRERDEARGLAYEDLRRRTHAMGALSVVAQALGLPADATAEQVAERAKRLSWVVAEIAGWNQGQSGLCDLARKAIRLCRDFQESDHA